MAAALISTAKCGEVAVPKSGRDSLSTFIAKASDAESPSRSVAVRLTVLFSTLVGVPLMVPPVVVPVGGVWIKPSGRSDESTT